MNHRVILLLGAMTSLSACLPDDDPAGSADIPADSRWELFKQSAIKISDSPERYVFGGDMVAVGEDGLRREFERYFGAQSAGGDLGTASSALTVDHANGAD